MHYAVQYRLKPDEVSTDRRYLYEVYIELATEKPPWLSCATFLLDEVGSMLFLLATDFVDRLVDLPCLSAYLHEISARCEGEPRAGVVERFDIDTRSITELGSWEPELGRWTLPPVPTGAVP